MEQETLCHRNPTDPGAVLGAFRKIRLAKGGLHRYNIPRSADIAQLVEHRLPKPRVAGSNPVVRSIEFQREAEKASLF